MQTHEEIREAVLHRADSDADFRARLLADPPSAIAEVIGASIPDTVTIVVHEDSPSTFHLVLPPDTQLSESDLELVSGGYRGVDPGPWSGASPLPT